MAAWMEIGSPGGSVGFHPCQPRSVIKISLRTGITEEVRLPDDLGDWNAREKDPDFQASIRGLALIFNGTTYCLPPPSGLARPRYSAEILMDQDRVVAHRIGYHVYVIQTRLTLYTGGNPPLCRFDVAKVGRLVWRP